jgi:rubrerythrin
MSFARSKECLKAGIVAEFQAIHKYQRIAAVAEQAGFRNIAYLFDSLIFAEKIHIRNHRNALEDPSYESEFEVYTPQSTLENVRAAIEWELYEGRVMYPGFIKEIKGELDGEFGKVARLSFAWAKKVELNHAKVLKLALHAIKEGKDLEIDNIYVCRVCGNILLTDPKESCPVCGHDSRFYKKIERNERRYN